MGIPLVEGRTFQRREIGQTRSIIIIARWRDKCLDVERRSERLDPSLGAAKIVGVVGDVKSDPFGVQPRPTIYWPLAQLPMPLMSFLYLLSVIVGYFDLMYLPGAFLVPGNAGATVHNIATHEFLFRIAMVADLVTGTLWLLVVVALYRLLRRVDETQANLMVILGAFMQVPLYFVNVVNYMAAVLLVRGGGYLSGLAIVQREAVSMLFLRLHHFETEARLIFAGLWLMRFGILVYKSGFCRARWAYGSSSTASRGSP